MKRFVAPLVLLVAACALPPADSPPDISRMGRFLGLVARCSCSDISPQRMLAEYPKALGGRYSDAQIKAMHGYVDLAEYEQWDNQIEICAEVCGQRCMVESVVLPLAGRSTGAEPCAVTERDLHLTEGRKIETGGGDSR
jgi:hypothetical protein